MTVQVMGGGEAGDRRSQWMKFLSHYACIAMMCDAVEDRSGYAWELGCSHQDWKRHVFSACLDTSPNHPPSIPILKDSCPIYRSYRSA